VAALAARVRELLNKNPRIRYGLVILVVALAAYLVSTRLFGGRPAPVATTRPGVSAPSATPTPRPAAPAPAPAAPAPAPAAPATPAPTAVPPGPTGRPDPFVPLVTQPTPGQPPAPGAPLPPPPFPVPGQLPPPPLPGQFPGAGAEVGVAITGIVGDTKAVAIVKMGNRTEIVMVGETIGDLRVLRIDSTRRIVTFLRAGRRFDVAMGGE